MQQQLSAIMFDRIDAESGRTLLADVNEKMLYDSALTVMMRLVFLFSAEERGLLLLGDPLYDQNYALSTLSELLRERADQHGEEILERRHDAWCRLIATFRAVHAGVEHEAMRLPAYGGTLFDPDRYPFLEGRTAGSAWRNATAAPLLINNRVVLHLLEALQLLRVKVSGGGPAEARRLSFRALDIEQIGHVYEGLLDHTAKRAHEPILGLAGSKDKEPEIPLTKLEEVAQKGGVALVEFLHEETGRSEKALTRLIEEPNTFDEHALLIACGQDERLTQRVRPFTELLRQDSFGQLVVIPLGSVYVTSGSDRRSTGTHYTPRSLTEPIVKHTLEPLVYVGPAEGQPEAEWTLRSPMEILALKVCDMTMGSGAFLVEVCRYLAERLVEAWEKAEREHPGSFVVTPDGELSAGTPTERLIPADSAERIAIARRYVADRCLYGVDINPMAVEMAKLSLWLITLQRDRPFTFLDHALKCGDSLLGVSSLKQVENFSLRPGETQITFATANLFRYVEEASAKRRSLEDLPSNNHAHIEIKTRLHAEAEATTAKVKALADTLIAFELRGLDGEAYDEQRTVAANQADLVMRESLPEFQAFARGQLLGVRPFHWCLEFPEVQQGGGFSAFVGNPPFMRGTKIQTNLSERYLRALLAFRQQINGNADLCAHFFRSAFEKLTSGGCFGLLATNTIAQGDTREGGLQFILDAGAAITRAISSVKWLGVAAVVVSVVWVNKGRWSGIVELDDKPVVRIDSFLSSVSAVEKRPHHLVSAPCNYHNGSFLNGTGFVVEGDEAKALLSLAGYDRVIRPYIGGKDTYSTPDPAHPARFIIYFGKMSKTEADKWPEAMRVVRERVWPERSVHKTKQLREMWWIFKRPTPELYGDCLGKKRVIVKTQVSSTYAFVFVPASFVFDQRLIVFPDERASVFSVLQSSFHEMWALRYAATLKEDMSYTPSDCFETFAFPPLPASLQDAGDEYHEFRRQIMRTRQEGLTKTYNRFHDRGEKAEDIAQLRTLHVEMDQTVAAAYGWSDLDLGHGFHETKQGVRYTISDFARRTVLDRLLALNHQRYEEEVRAGLHKKGAKKSNRKTASKGTSVQGSLI